ncbi:hypothetical protein CfE428DRAFT_6714 [Chthoniobacter flavus Ellin428]|uniref:Uncharacterized protein n=1 Tax=Chthoniobacter flavus Ellin428 TaxID=497964 RepID=B4DCS3_9BACT|nr:hypothetical protein [Chthoniobacter flavus]EDY15761.1 hypothetical protein CfE428DRAFT_6714 [Chthoniobacter flavus Ellin428]TCO81566.1 hypothetical protein EV701_1601 [Chthoniobacter flavus]
MSSAIWSQGIFSNRLADDKTTELWIYSFIYTGTLGDDASIRFEQKIKVPISGKPFTVVSPVYQRKDEPQGAKYKETLTVTLRKTNNPDELRAEYEHIVYRNKKIFLRFAGTLVDNRWSGS